MNGSTAGEDYNINSTCQDDKFLHADEINAKLSATISPLCDIDNDLSELDCSKDHVQLEKDSTTDKLDVEEPITQLLDSSSNSLEECETFLLDDSFLEDKDNAVEDKFNSIDQIEKNINNSFKCLQTENVTENYSSKNGEKIKTQLETKVGIKNGCFKNDKVQLLQDKGYKVINNSGSLNKSDELIEEFALDSESESEEQFSINNEKSLEVISNGHPSNNNSLQDLKSTGIQDTNISLDGKINSKLNLTTIVGNHSNKPLDVHLKPKDNKNTVLVNKNIIFSANKAVNYVIPPSKNGQKVKPTTVVKSYKCETCGKEFSKHSKLKRHMLIHVKVNPFPCLLCGRRFKRKDHLRGHVKAVVSHGNACACERCRTHFFCEIDTLNLIAKRNCVGTQAVPCKCKLCGDVLEDMVSLKEHFKYYHEDKARLLENDGSNMVRAIDDTIIDVEENPSRTIIDTWFCVYCQKVFNSESQKLNHHCKSTVVKSSSFSNNGFPKLSLPTSSPIYLPAITSKKESEACTSELSQLLQRPKKTTSSFSNEVKILNNSSTVTLSLKRPLPSSHKTDIIRPKVYKSNASLDNNHFHEKSKQVFNKNSKPAHFISLDNPRTSTLFLSKSEIEALPASLIKKGSKKLVISTIPSIEVKKEKPLSSKLSKMTALADKLMSKKNVSSKKVDGNESQISSNTEKGINKSIYSSYSAESSLKPSNGEYTIKSIKLNYDLDQIRQVAQFYDNDEVFECDFCPRTFEFIEGKLAHEMAHNFGFTKNIPCYFCNVTVKDHSKMVRHLRKHTCSKPFQCVHPACKKRFARKDHLTSHYANQCGFPEDYVSGSNKRTHTFTSTSKLHAKFSCKMCTHTFMNERNLIMHRCGLSEEENRNNSKFTNCKSPFNGNSMVAFSKSSASNTFTSTIARNPPRVPDLKTPNTDLNVVAVAREESDGDYMCTFCSERFHNESQFNEHISSRHGSKGSFECLLCPHSIFDICCELLMHMDMHHEGVVTSQFVKCRLCDLIFGSCNELYTHASEHHKDVLKHV